MATWRPLMTSELRRMREMAAAGKRVADVAAAIGRTPAAAAKLAQRYGIRFRAKSGQPNRVPTERLLELRRAGMTYRQIAAACGYRRHCTIGERLRREAATA